MARRRRYSYMFLGVLGFFGVFQFWNVMTSVRVWISSSWEKMYIWFSISLQLLSELSPCVGYERVALPSATFLSIILPGGMWVQVNHILCSYITRWFIIFIWRHTKKSSVVQSRMVWFVWSNRWWDVASESGMCLNATVINSAASYPGSCWEPKSELTVGL